MAVRTSAMEGLVVSCWQGKHVLVTGHTGFKGSWLSLWLLHLGAHVTGFALPPDTTPSLFDQLGLAGEMDHRIGDIRDPDLVAGLISEVRPDAVFHLAAQSLVLNSYREPIYTWQANVMGTIHLLEALRALNKPCAAVLITTDKVYENREWEYGYRECDALGGYDPYSSSKAAAEIAISCWRRSFLNGISGVKIASARAGNVIGGGDWAENRIVPDMVRALSDKRTLKVRNANAIRPWQHVLEPLGGYMLLAQRLFESDKKSYQDAFNFGPMPDAERSVHDLVEEALRHWPGTWEDGSDPDMPHEAGRLALNIDHARSRLGWEPRWDFERAVAETIVWYRSSIEANPAERRDMSVKTIQTYADEAAPE